MELARQENLYDMQDIDNWYSERLGGAEYEDGDSASVDNANNSQHLGVTILASKFAKNTRRGAQKMITRIDPDDSILKMHKMFMLVDLFAL
ncbi:hypothetical protein CRYUN_Cryun12cG0138100 [Craigia yunnanensis]